MTIHEDGNTVHQNDTPFLSQDMALKRNPQMSALSTQEYRIPCFLVDKDSRLKTDAYFQLLQDALDLYGLEKKITPSFIKDQNLTWVIRNHDIQIKQPPKWNDHIVIDTAASNLRRLTMTFSSRAYSSDRKKLLFASTSQVVLLSTLNYRPEIIKERLPHLQALATEEKNNFEAIPDITRVDQEQNREIISENIDFNHHCNNINYVRFANLAVPDDFREGKVLEQVRIQYKNPAILGDKIAIQTEINDTNTHHKIVSSQNKALEYARVHIRWKER